MDYSEFTLTLNTEFVGDCKKDNSDTPWFGHFIIVDDEGESLSYKIGTKNLPSQRIINRFHPLANAYYRARPGDYFDMEEHQSLEKNTAHQYKNIMGDLRYRTTITPWEREIQQATIQSDGDEVTLEKSLNGYVIQGSQEESELIGDYFEELMVDEHSEVSAATKAAFQRPHVDGLPDISALLTPEQYELITQDTDKPLIIQGQAGSGKTTVALFRVSWLMQHWETEKQVDPQKVFIVMFNKPLETFIQTTLDPLELGECQVSTFASWVLKEIHNAYSGRFQMYTAKMRKYIDEDAAEVVDAYGDIASDIKNHAGMLSAIDAFIQRQTGKLEGWLEDKLAPYGADDIIEEIQYSHEPIVKLLKTLRTRTLTQKNAADGVEQQRLEQVYLVLDKAVSRMTQYKEELLKLLKDTALLKQHLTDFSERQLEQLAAYQTALQGVKAKSNRPGPYISFDDSALMLRLIQLKHGGFPEKDSDNINLFDHIVIDEAQDFGAIQLKVLLSAVKSSTGITIVGDMNQKIMPTVEFPGWDALADQLNIGNASVAKLAVAHRSTPSIMNLANSIIGEPLHPDTSGIKPTLLDVADKVLYIEAVADHLQDLSAKYDNDHICLLCRTSWEAKSLNSQLKKHIAQHLGEDAPLLDNIRLSHNNNFEFTRGITITNMQQIKGLEFEVVVIVNPADDFYTTDEQGKRYLYTAITRARKELRFICLEKKTPLLQTALDEGLLDVHLKSNVVPVEFTDDDDEPF